MFTKLSRNHDYQALRPRSQHLQDKECDFEPTNIGQARYPLQVVCGCVLLSLLSGFILGALCVVFIPLHDLHRGNGTESLASRIPLSTIQRSFDYSTPFSLPPPRGGGAGNTSEPVWDSLIPLGLGYFRDDHLAPQTSIPTVFHQLHCLYILRRAYYSSSDELQRFDFGKDREAHVPHCFDYLQQGLTCSADSTVEVAVNPEHGFLGGGIQRQCRDFQQLKAFVEERRVFNATGFLANGLHINHGDGD